MSDKQPEISWTSNPPFNQDRYSANLYSSLVCFSSSVPCQYQVKDLTTWPGHMQANMVVTMPVDATSYILRVETSRPILKFVVSLLSVCQNVLIMFLFSCGMQMSSQPQARCSWSPTSTGFRRRSRGRRWSLGSRWSLQLGRSQALKLLNSRFKHIM